MTELPQPPVPADCDLTGFDYTPIYRARLFGSAFHARATDAEWRAGVTLWLKSWEQVPAGSLPDDDIDLCRLAELGRDMKTWNRIKAGAMRGWEKASDGRLYHPVVAEVVAEAWEKRSKASRKGKAGASKRWGAGNATAIAPDSTGTGQAMPGDSNGRERNRREGKGKKNPVPSEPTGTAPPPPSSGEGSVVERAVETTPTAGTLPLGEPPPDDMPEIPLALVQPEGSDWRKALFRQGLDWLARASKKSPDAVRGAVGMWLKTAQQDHRAVFDKLAEAQKLGIAEPVAWVTAALAARAGTSGQQASAAADAEFLRRLDEQLGAA